MNKTRQIFGLTMFLAGIVLIGYGVNVFPKPPLSTVVQNGVTVTWTRSRSGLGVELSVQVPENSGYLVWGDKIYIWVSRIAIFKYQDNEGNWHTAEIRCTLWGPGGSVRAPRACTYIVDFETATSSWTTRTSYQFVGWTDIGQVDIAGISLRFDLKALAQQPPTEEEQPPTHGESQYEVPPQTEAPTEQPTTQIDATATAKMNPGYVALGVVVSLVGILMLMVKRGKDSLS